MSLRTKGLHYKTLQLGELQCLMRARGFKEITHDVSECLIALEGGDDACFQFGALPPEMRNRIYNELLLLPEQEPETETDSICHPQILACSSGIHEEATSILYGVNELRIDITKRITTYKRGTEDHRIHSNFFCVLGRRLPKDLGRLRMGLDKWPHQVSRFHRIRIHLKFETSGRREWGGVTRMPNILYSLVSCLPTSESLKSITVVCDTKEAKGYIGTNDLTKWLYPLARLCATFQCHFEGLTEYPDVETTLRAQASANAELYKKNHLAHANAVLAEMEAFNGVVCTYPSREKQNALRSDLFDVLDKSLDNIDTERALESWTATASSFLDQEYQDDIIQEAKEAAALWSKGWSIFKRTHEQRVKAYPEVEALEEQAADEL